MGQNESFFKKTYSETVSQLSSVQLSEITARFNDLYATAGGSKGLVVDREAFSKYLNLPVAVGDRLFDAFDEKQNGSICFEEFVCGLAIVLHGSFKERCSLLFRVFNLGNDEGISREELSTMLSAICQSTNTILYTVGETDRAVLGGEDMGETIKAMVDAAFANCDISKTGKLLPVEFEYWLKRNPKILDTLLSFKTKKEECTLGPLIMSPSEQKLSTASHSPQSSIDPSTTHHQHQKKSPFSSRRTSQEKRGSDILEQGNPGKLFQVGELSQDSLGSVSSVQSSLTSDVLHSVSMNTEEASLGQQNSSSQDLGQGGRSLGSDGRGLETQRQGGSGDDIIDDRTNELQLEHNTGVENPLASQISLQMDALGDAGDVLLGKGSSSSVAVELEDGSNVDQVDKGGEILSDAITDAPQVGLDMEAIERVNRIPQTDSFGVEADTSADHVISGDTGSIIMNAASGLSLDLPLQVQNYDKLGPASPILPTQTLDERMLREAPLISEFEEVEEGVEEGKEEEDLHMTVRMEVSENRNVTGDRTGPENGNQNKESGFPPPSSSVPRFNQSVPPSMASSLLENVDVGSKVDEDIYQAWVLSSWTKELLDRSQLGTHLTCPALMTDIRLIDGISDMLTTNFPDKPRMTLLSVEHVSMDAEGLRRLVISDSLHAALELTARFLSAHGQGLGQAGQPTIHTRKTLQMWSARISLLYHLKLYKEAELELQAFGEMLNPDLYYQYHTTSYPNKKGSLVPFTLRLLHANIPRHTGKVQLAMDRLSTLQYVCEQILTHVVARGTLPDRTESLSTKDKEDAENVWRERLARVKYSLANTLIFIQDYGLAIKLYEQLSEEHPKVKTEVLSGIGRLYLQLGDLKRATSYFDRVKKLLGDLGDENLLVILNEAYVNVFLSRWQMARDSFEAALTFDPTNKVILSNITVCSFYMGRLKESIVAMEMLLTSDPPSSLQPSLFANLATTYELESGNSIAKKLSFLPLLAQHIGQGYQHLSQLNIR